MKRRATAKLSWQKVVRALGIPLFILVGTWCIWHASKWSSERSVVPAGILQFDLPALATLTPPAGDEEAPQLIPVNSPGVAAGMAVNLYRHLTPAEAATIGTTLLTQATRRNPYNPAPWYLLAQHAPSPGQAVALAKAAEEQMRAVIASNAPEQLKASRHAYWQMVEKRVVELGLLSQPPVQDPVVARQVCDFLLTVPGVTAEQKMPYLISVLNAGETQNASSAKQLLAQNDAAMVGDWACQVIDKGFYADRSFRSDHTVWDKGARIGTWETNAKRFMVHLENGATDFYDLPAQHGVLYGTNLLGWRLQITCKTALASR